MCEVYYKNCQLIEKTDFDKTKLMSQEEKKDKKKIIYTAKKLNKKIDKGWYFENDFNKFNEKNFLDKTVYFTDGIILDFDEIKKNLNIRKKLPNARVLIRDQVIDGWTFNFSDETNLLDNNSILTDLNGLTGCLTFFNTALEKVNIYIKNAMCEDGVNFINSTGEIDNIKINQAMSDGIDLDFSNFKMNNISIDRAKNDCIDFSYGNYEIGNLIVYECGDKGISVGESSIVNVLNFKSNLTNISIASKDSSRLKLKYVDINDTKYCFSAYRKKQEFFGASLKIDDGHCKNYVQQIELDKMSKISYKNNILKSLP